MKNFVLLMANRAIRKKSTSRPLSRQESKLVTRHRLLEAGLALLAERGYEGVTTGRVARRAGVAQPTFYVHFRDKDELLRAVASDALAKIRVALREVRLRLGHGGDVMALTRETFRLPLSMMAEQHGDLLRLFVAELYRPHSAIGRSGRDLIAELTADLVEDLAAIGITAAVPTAELALISETVIMLTVHFGMAHVEARKLDLDALADLLARTTVYLLLDAAGSPPTPRRGRL